MKKYTQDIRISNLFLSSKLVLTSKKKKTAMVEKNVENSLLITVFKEKGKPGFFQFLNLGKSIGVFSAHIINEVPNFFLKNSSSEKIILS